MNDVVTDTAAELSGGIFIVKLDDLLKDRGLFQKDLASMTGIRVGTISEWLAVIAHQKTKTNPIEQPPVMPAGGFCVPPNFLFATLPLAFLPE